MATFYNQATLIYNGNETNSNITEGQILNGADITKIALSSNYAKQDGVNYAISLVNTAPTSINNLTITDNLGAFIPIGLSTEVTPLTYVENSLIYYINGVLSTPLETEVTPEGLVISGINLPPNSNALILYETRANEFAPLSAGSSITNTVTLSGVPSTEETSASATVPVRNFTNLTISKAICPETISDNSELSYTFIIQNSGNTPAVATDNVVITDTFTPIINPITVTLNGEVLTEGTDYTYDSTTGEFKTLIGTVTVPAATFTTNPTTGAVISSPGVSVLKIDGII